MGGEAALAYSIASGLVGTGGAYANAGSIAKSSTFMPDRTSFDASLGAYQKSLETEYSATSKQADLILEELGTEATRRAQESEFQQNETAEHFTSKGVTLDGTPLEIIAKQRALKMQEIDHLSSRAVALADLERAKGTIAYNEGLSRIAGAKGDYITKAAQYSLANESSAFAAKSYSGSSFMNLLGSTFGLLSQTQFGQKLTNGFKRINGPTINGVRTYSPAKSLFSSNVYSGNNNTTYSPSNF